jgi:hypothetical protein
VELLDLLGLVALFVPVYMCHVVVWRHGQRELGSVLVDRFCL